ncbi:MAG: tRNA threonylcarbamoyladenosine dehydratase [Mycobacterium sp.]|nr:tRNA threonylcarbamoyladenosine dehydratase [Mycobacterium sp.]MDT5400067.1 tRNA threonylcarbamoyladenosine dehydratase [Mycobacterium sp.]
MRGEPLVSRNGQSPDQAVWEPPTILKVSGGSGRSGLTQLFGTGVDVIDPVNEIIEELCQLRACEGATGQTRDTMHAEDDAFGHWVYLPWKNAVVRYPDPDDHYELRTFRNRHVITADEHQLLRHQTVAFFGLSVGRRVLSQVAQLGIGNRYLFGDPDRISVTNLNRLNSSMSEVGLSKTVSAAREISDIDPYIAQVHLEDGYTTPEAEQAMDQWRPLVIVEEVDDLRAKAAVREYAMAKRIPVVMATDVGDISVVHVERYDTEDVSPFSGRVSDDTFARLRDHELTPQELVSVLLDVSGRDAALGSPRLIKSFMDIGRGLAGLAQLGTTVGMGASMAALAIREIALGRPLPSGSYVADPRELLSLSDSVSDDERAAIMSAFEGAFGVSARDGAAAN